jgi:hypothetical protein
VDQTVLGRSTPRRT